MSKNKDPAPTKICSGNPCPKCGVAMLRFKHSDQWQPIPGRGWFAFWDQCSSCKHTHNYKAAHRRTKKPIEPAPVADPFISREAIFMRLESVPTIVARQPVVLQRQIDEFYASWEWKQLSYETKKQRGRRCECCGATPNHGAHIITDHIKPLRFYWDLRLDPRNMQVLCDDCNKGKASRDETDWRTH